MASGPNAPERPSASDPPARPSLEAGRTTLGKYQIVRQLGAGGMGTVYLAVDSQLKRTVALKVLPKERTENETLVLRFEAEARAAAQLRHENIVTVYDAGRIDGHLYIALEFVDGDDIYERVAKRGSLPLKRSIDFIKQVARALEHLHKRGYVHRDIKPSNLLVTKEGVVKVTDMGLARAVDESLRSNITREGTTVGTVDYMAPEQARDSQAADIRSDIYSLGCAWYQMLTGEAPFPTGSVTNKLFAHISRPRPDPRTLNSSIPEEVVAVLHRMMARKVADRYQSPTELLRDLDQLGTGRSRLDELLGSEGSDDIPMTPTPSRGTPTLPPPGTIPRRRAAGDSTGATRAADPPGFDIPPPSPRLPTRQLPPGGRHEPIPRPGVLPRRGTISDEPFIPPLRSGSSGTSSGAPRGGLSVLDIDWKALAMKGAAAVGGIVALGALIWLAHSYWGGDARGAGQSARKGVGDASTDESPADEGRADDAKKSAAEQAKNDAEKKKAESRQRAVPPIVSKRLEEKPADPLPVRGRPGELAHFPAWIAEVWDPHPAGATKSAASLKTIAVGRVDKDLAGSPSLTAAIEQLPEEGGVIELRGRGPFVLPALRIANRGHVVITGALPVDPGATGAKSSGRPLDVANQGRPVIAIVPGGGLASESGVLATETSLTLYGVDLVAFADEFPAENAIRLVDVRSGDLTIRQSSLTLVGARNGETAGFSVSGPSPAVDRPARVLLDRVVVRGRELTAIDADIRSVDLMAINSLFVTGKAPVLNLLSGGPAAAAAKEPQVLRNLRFFSCTACTDDATVSLRSASEQATPPATRFEVMNSVFGAVFQPQGAAMIALNNWPVRPVSAESHAPAENLTWATESFIVRGWRRVLQSDSGAHLDVKDGRAWATFWGVPGTAFLYEPTPFPAVGDYATIEPARFKSESLVGSQRHSVDTSPPGCDAAVLATPRQEAVVRADALSRRPRVPVQFLEGAAADASVKEINLENSSWHDLAKFINERPWNSGTRFVVHGTGKKTCSPIHVVNKSLTIEFTDTPPPLMRFEIARGDSRAQRPAFISVSGGTIELVNARFQIEPTTRPSPHWLLDVVEGSFSIRDSMLQGPSYDNPGYEGLIHFSPAEGRGATPLKPFWGHVRNSFLLTNRTIMSAELAYRNINIENSILAADSRTFDLRVPAASAAPPVIDLRFCTLAAGNEYFRVEPIAANQTPGRVRVYADNTVFGPPLRAEGKTSNPALIGEVGGAATLDRVDWWDYACAYSSVVTLPGASGQNRAVGGDRLAAWQQFAGPLHVLRSIEGTNAVLLPRDLPLAKEVMQSDFRLKPVAEAATWSDLGGPVGANLATDLLPPAKEPAPHKTPTKKPASTSGGGGL